MNPIQRPPPPKKAGAEKKNREKQVLVPEAEVKLSETDGWITRIQAAETLHRSLQSLKNYEKEGLLHPKKAWRTDSNGFERWMVVYNPRELSAISARVATRGDDRPPHVLLREPGEQAARVFALLREGRPLDEIVIEVRETPDRIDYLNERWLEQTRARYVITKEAKVILEQLVGTFEDVTEMIDRIRSKIGVS